MMSHEKRNSDHRKMEKGSHFSNTSKLLKSKYVWTMRKPVLNSAKKAPKDISVYYGNGKLGPFAAFARNTNDSKFVI